MSQLLYIYDFTISSEHTTKEDIVKLLNEYCKKWTFQLEEGKSGYIHFQGRFSLKAKARKTTLIKEFTKFDGAFHNLHLSPTNNSATDDDFYVSKIETRLDGPWRNTDVVEYIPRQIREVKELHPWQQKIVDSATIWDTRSINWIWNVSGNVGKSIIKTYIGVHKIGRNLPFCTNYKDIMRMVMCTESKPLYIIDIPRAINKQDLAELIAGIETVKDGYAYDDRYTFKEKYFDCPNIWIFSNTKPNLSYLTLERWKIWTISEDLELVRYNP